jgi:protein SCO1/2
MSTTLDSEQRKNPAPGGQAPSDVDKKTPFYKNIYFLCFLAGAVIITAIRPFLRHEPPPPPVQGLLPDYELVNQDGAAFGSKQLEGQVYVASFLFTSCTTVCPLIAKGLLDLQKRYEDDGVPIKIVSFSVDPGTDVPSVLKDYGTRLGFNPARWTFLTGDELKLRRVLTAFSVPLEPKRALSGGLMDIAHSQKLVIVDGRGRIRGHYGSDDEGIDEVFHRSKHVLNAKVNAE